MSTSGITTATEDRALKLLGSGIKPEQVAAALGVEASRISQLLSQEEFAVKVAEARYNNLAKHNEHDGKLDALEDEILDKLKASLAYIFHPLQLLKVLSVLNAAKRRGASTPENITTSNPVLVLNIPSIVINKFTTNINNQVVEAGNQKLVTIQSGTLMDQLKAAAKIKAEVTGTTYENEPQRALTDREAVGS